jgi:hypothetical protein
MMFTPLAAQAAKAADHKACLVQDRRAKSSLHARLVSNKLPRRCSKCSLRPSAKATWQVTKCWLQQAAKAAEAKLLTSLSGASLLSNKLQKQMRQMLAAMILSGTGLQKPCNKWSTVLHSAVRYTHQAAVRVGGWSEQCIGCVEKCAQGARPRIQSSFCHTLV